MGVHFSSKKRQRDRKCVEAGLGAKKARKPPRNLHDVNNVPGRDYITPPRNQQDGSPTVFSPRQGEGTQAFSEAPDFKLESPHTGTQGFRRKHCVGGHRTLHFPNPDYSKHLPKVNTWKRKPKSGGEDKDPVPDDTLPSRNEKGSHGKGTEVCDGQVKCAQAPDIKPESPDTTPGGIRRQHRAGVHRILDFPIPDYTKIPHKVDCWRRKPKSGGEGKDKVPDTLPTRNQKGRSPTPMSQSHGKENLQKICAVRQTSPPAEGSVPVKPVSESVKRNLPLRGSVEKSIHNPDNMRNESEVNPSRIAPKIGGVDKAQAQPQKKEHQGWGCFRWWRKRRRKPKNAITVPLPDDTLPTRNEKDISTTPMSQSHGKGTEVCDGQVKCAQAPDIKPKSPDTTPGGIRRQHRAGVHRIMDFPIPDYTKIPPIVDCWRRKPISGGEDKDKVPDDTLPTRNQ
jgi:hypothetical protein